jgi:hypothetical protein
VTANRSEAEPDPYIMAAVVSLVRRLDAHDADTLGVPIVTPMSDRISDLNERDRAIEEELDALTAVCLRPIDRLGTEHVLVRAAEARRVPVEGLVRLASRTEDWLGRDDSGGILPARLLTVRFEEDFDYFENRMAAQLVDRLRRYLARRLRDLDTLERHVEGLDRYARALHDTTQSHWKRRRLSVLLGEAAEDGTVHAAAIKAAADRLRPLLCGLDRLRGTRLYRQANRRASIPFRLPRTNLLTRDLRYRRTAALWEAWALGETGAADEHRDDRENFSAAYRTFVAAAAARALDVLGLEPLWPEQTITVNGPAIEVGSAGRTIARIISAPADLTAVPAAEAHSEVTDDVPTVIAYPGLRTDRERLPPAQRAHAHWTGPRASGSRPFGVIPVNPLEIESTERLARALRWALWAPYVMDSYSRQIPVPPWWRPQHHSWIEFGHERLQLLRPPSGSEYAALAAEIRRADDDRPRRQGEMHQQTATDVTATLDEVASLLAGIAACPICRGSEATRFEPRAEGTFHCRCDLCKGQWGIRKCSVCSRRFPVLWAHGATVVPIDNEDDVDNAYGSDIAALPCPESPDWTHFKCPWCDVCQSEGRCTCAGT